MLSRDGREATDEHIQVIRDWKGIEDVTGLRRFLGTFNWVREHFPKEYVLALKVLAKYLQKDAEWPLSLEAEKAKRVLQKLAERAIRLSA
eukprot:12041625-Heterocapsa_arctica.AAC.1